MLVGICGFHRSVFGIVSQLGFLPHEDFDAVELTAQGDESLALHYPILRNSDSHQLETIGAVSTELNMDALTVPHIRAALRSRD